jgi:hypothetical protein
MPCNAIATVRARLVTGLEETAQAICARREGLAAHAAAIERMLSVAGLGRVWTDVGADWIDFRMGGGFVRIRAGSIRVAFRNPEQAAKAENALRAYGGLLVQAKAKMALLAIGCVTGEVRMPNGAVMLSLEV